LSPDRHDSSYFSLVQTFLLKRIFDAQRSFKYQSSIYQNNVSFIVMTRAIYSKTSHKEYK